MTTVSKLTKVALIWMRYKVLGIRHCPEGGMGHGALARKLIDRVEVPIQQ
jgi:hypothetical protein